VKIITSETKGGKCLKPPSTGQNPQNRDKKKKGEKSKQASILNSCEGTVRPAKKRGVGGPKVPVQKQEGAKKDGPQRISLEDVWP